MKKSLKTTLIFIGISLAVGALSAFFTRNNMNVFDSITSPPLTPPPIVFPIVWTILYILMGWGAARVYLKDPDSPAITTFAINLIVNFFWSIIFFNMRAFTFAFIWLLLLLAIVVLMTIQFSRVDKLAGYMQIPYIVWLLLAGYLNLSIVLLN